MPTHMKTVERDLTEGELASLGQEQAHILADIEMQEAEAKSSASLYKSAITEMKKKVKEITKNINRKVDYRDVECDVLLNTPTKGRKTYISVETGAHVAIEDMLESEKQSSLFDDDDRASEAEGA